MGCAPRQRNYVIFLALGVSEEGGSGDTSCALGLISAFALYPVVFDGGVQCYA